MIDDGENGADYQGCFYRAHQRIALGTICENGAQVCACRWVGRLLLRHAYQPLLVGCYASSKCYGFIITYNHYSLRRRDISSSVVPVVTSSYKRACATLGRRIRPRRWMYSRLVLLPLTMMATRQSGTSTPSLRTRPVTSLVYWPERKRSRMVRRSSVGVL